MNQDDKKIDIPKNIQEELQEFKTYNTDYNKSKIPFNKIDKNDLLIEWLSRHEYILFKLANQRELELNESETNYLKEIADLLTNMWKEDLKREITKERNEKLKSINDLIGHSKRDGTLYKDFVFWFSIYLNDSIKKIENVFEEIKKQNEEVSKKDFEKIPTENKTALLERINKKNDTLISEQIITCNAATQFATIFVCQFISLTQKKSNDENDELCKIFKNFILNLDQLFFYTFALLNCQKLLIYYSNHLYETMIFYNPKDSHAFLQPQKVYYDSTLMYVQIVELYDELFPKFQNVFIFTTKSLNELPD